MPRCAGFVRARFSSGWSPCAGRALKGDVLCGGHRDALDPALLGIMEFEQAQQFQKQMRSGRRSFPPVRGRQRRAWTETPVLSLITSGDAQVRGAKPRPDVI